MQCQCIICAVLVSNTTKPIMTSPGYTFYWLQCNGLDERFNQTLQTKLVRDKKEEWSDILDSCVFVYNTSQHESSKFTPFELTFNRNATITIDIELRMKESEELAVTFSNMKEPDHASSMQVRKKERNYWKRLSRIFCVSRISRKNCTTKSMPNHIFMSLGS